MAQVRCSPLLVLPSGRVRRHPRLARPSLLTSLRPLPSLASPPGSSVSRSSRKRQGRTRLGGASCLPRVRLASAWGPGLGWGALGLRGGLCSPLLPPPSSSASSQWRRKGSHCGCCFAGMPALLRGSERLNSGWGWESDSSSALSLDGLREGWSVASHLQSCATALLLSRGTALGELLSLPSPGSASVRGRRGSAAERAESCSGSTGKGEAVCGSSPSFSRGNRGQSRCPGQFGGVYYCAGLPWWLRR